jgi:hypothetical protein
VCTFKAYPSDFEGCTLFNPQVLKEQGFLCNQGKMAALFSSVTANFEKWSSCKGKAVVDFFVMTAILLIVGIVIHVAPEAVGPSEAAVAVVGALCYGALQASRKVTRNTLRTRVPAKSKIHDSLGKPKTRSANISTRCQALANQVGKKEIRQVSLQPVSAPIFTADNFEAQVHELLSRIAPSAEGDSCVNDITVAVKRALRVLIPEADVVGLASGDVLRGTAFAVAIPEVDIILSASPSVIIQRLQNNASRYLPHASKLDARKLQKSMLRACTDELTAAAGFKFRRSAFKDQEPKVILMAEINGKNIPISFSVNTTTALHNAALLTECGQIEPRAKELILLVRRWAKDRGISHAAKGHLSPYSWSLLVIYFLQVWNGEDKPLLPQITAFKKTSGLLWKQQMQINEQQRSYTEQSNSQIASVARLFEEFMRFYTRTFDWRHEAVCVRSGMRQPPSTSLHLHIVMLENDCTEVAPSIVDPFEPRRNLSDAMTGVSFRRLREELVRAQGLCSRHAALDEVLEPWVPPEA